MVEQHKRKRQMQQHKRNEQITPHFKEPSNEKGRSWKLSIKDDIILTKKNLQEDITENQILNSCLEINQENRSMKRLQGFYVKRSSNGQKISKSSKTFPLFLKKGFTFLLQGSNFLGYIHQLFSQIIDYKETEERLKIISKQSEHS